MKTWAWDRILSVLGLIFAVVPWLWPDLSLETKVAATVVIGWLILTIYMLISNRLRVMWPVFSLGLVIATAVLGYTRLLALQPPRTHQVIIFSLALLFLIVILTFAGTRPLQQDFQSSVFLAEPDALEQLEPFIENAEEIFLCGLTLGGLVSHCSRMIEHLVREKKCHLRIILPQENVILSSAHRISLDYTPHTKLIREYQDTLAWLDQLTEQGGEKVQLRTTETLPTISLLFVNPGTDKARLRVSLHIFEGALNRRPHFELNRRNHPKWYDFFAQKYCIDLWHRSTPRETGAMAAQKISEQLLRKSKSY